MLSTLSILPVSTAIMTIVMIGRGTSSLVSVNSSLISAHLLSDLGSGVHARVVSICTAVTSGWMHRSRCWSFSRTLVHMNR